MRNMTSQELTSRLLLFSRRAKTLCGTGLDENGQECALGESVSVFLATMAANINDPKAIAARNEFLAKVEKDPVAKAQFCALQLKTYNNYLLARATSPPAPPSAPSCRSPAASPASPRRATGPNSSWPKSRRRASPATCASGRGKSTE